MLSDHQAWVAALAATPDGTRIISGGADGIVRVWQLSTGVLERRIEFHEGKVLALAVTPDGRLVVVGREDGTVDILELHSGRIVRTLTRTYFKNTNRTKIAA